MRPAVWLVSLAGLAVATWALVTAGPAIVHGNPAYAVMIVLTVLGAALALWRYRQARQRHGWRLAASVALTLLAAVWVASVWWLRPFPAVQPALAAMQSDAGVQVTESATRIIMRPTGAARPVGVFFQPGARVDARAYAAYLHPLAAAGYPVVIAKQPLGIAFLAMGAFNSARAQLPSVDRWVLGGHSLGGTVAAIEADNSDTSAKASPQGVSAAAGLLLWASYPADDLSQSLTSAVTSIYGTRDVIATPAEIAASKPDLPASTKFVPIKGAIHSFFGDYGLQPGDGEPTISHDQARSEITAASLAFVEALAKATTSP